MGGSATSRYARANIARSHDAALETTAFGHEREVLMADRVSIHEFDPFVENVWLRTSDARIALPRNANNLLRRVDDLVSLEERHIPNPINVALARLAGLRVLALQAPTGTSIRE